MKLVSFMGVERADFIYYVGRLLMKRKCSLLLIDNSVTGDLFLILAGRDIQAQKQQYIQKDKLVCGRNLAYNTKLFSHFDYCLCYNGLSEVDEIQWQSDRIYLVLDYHMSTLQSIKQAISTLESKVEPGKIWEASFLTVILRDQLTNRITDLAIARQLSMSEEKISYVIEADLQDSKKQIALEYSGRQRVAGLSEGYKRVLAAVLAELEEMSEKEAWKLAKKS